MKKYLLPVILTAATASAMADDSPLKDRLYVGANLSHNTIDSPFGGDDVDAGGYSIFTGLKFDNSIEGLTTSAELGYSDTKDFFDSNGDADINGVWVAGVAEKTLPEIDPRVSALARIGLDLGDDDGILLGAGLGFHATEMLSLRAEFINKDASSVYQVGAVFNF
ncbi:MAG: outer membrane beta-barrel protein [Thalassolituus sp.]|jgi:hypothetical protein